jgi:hypothetical protein
MRSKKGALAAAALIALALGSCVSVGPTTLDTKGLPGPEDHTLAFGYLGVHGPFGKTAMEYPRYIQLNPAFPAEVYIPFRPAGNTGYCYLYPQPVGSSWKLLSYQQTSGRSVTYFMQGVMGKNPYDPRMEAPGLLYIGTWAYGRDESYQGSAMSMDAWGIVELPDDGYELRALEAMLPSFKKTAWQPLIERRIEELKK